MKIIDAKNIALQAVVEQLGGTFSHKGRTGELWFYSPLRPTEKTASFRINEITNKWFDFGHAAPAYTSKSGAIGAGGDIIDLWCDCHFIDRREGVKQALKGLEKFANFVSSGMISSHAHTKHEPVEPAEPRFKILKLHEEIFYPQLKDELARRKISKETAAPYLRQAFIKDTKNPTRKINGFAWHSDKGGLEISIRNHNTGRSFKTVIGPKAITTVQGLNTQKVDIFESVFDFLVHLQMHQTTRPDCLTYIMNSALLTSQIVNKLISQSDTIQTIHLFMQNDPAGQKALNQITSELEPYPFTIGVKDFYQGYKDVNEWYILK